MAHVCAQETGVSYPHQQRLSHHFHIIYAVSVDITLLTVATNMFGVWQRCDITL